MAPGSAALALAGWWASAAAWMRGGTLALLLGLAAAIVAVVARGGGPRPAAMSFLGHLEELRRRLLASLLAVVLGVAFAFSFRWETWRGLPLPRPALYDPMAAQLFGVARRHAVPEGVTLVVTRPLDAFTAELWIAVGLGIALALPAVLWQTGAFLAPALGPRERRVLWRAAVPCAALFLAGATFAYAWVVPVVLRTLYGYADALGATPLLGVADFAAFLFGFMAGFGLAFQLPVVLHVLARVGLFTWRAGLRAWRHALLAIVVLSALLTPDGSPVSLALLAGPLAVLYAAGVGLAWLAERRASRASRSAAA